MIKAFFKLVDREGKVKIDDLVWEFRDYYVQQASVGLPLERADSPLADPTKPSDNAINMYSLGSSQFSSRDRSYQGQALGVDASSLIESVPE